MTKTWPTEITLSFRVGPSHTPIQSLIVSCCEFVTATKNNYGIGPLLTDECGHVIITRLDLKSEIEKSQTMWLMDYAGTIADLTGDMYVTVEDIPGLIIHHKSISR